MVFEMVFGWFGIFIVWLLFLVWWYVMCVLVGEWDFLKGWGIVWFWLVMFVVLSVSVVFEVLMFGVDL